MTRPGKEIQHLSSRLVAALACLVSASAILAAQSPPARRPPLDFKVLKVGEPVTGSWEFNSPVGGGRRQIEITTAEKGGLTGTLLPDGTRILTLSPKAEGIGYRGELLHLLAACGQDRVVVSDFVTVGDRAMMQIEAKPSEMACSFLENADTARWFVAPAANPVRLRAIGELTSDRTREDIGLGGQPGGPSTPILGGTISIESGSEMKYRGHVRSLDGSMWIEVEPVLSPAAGIEPPRGYLTAESLRIAATLTLTRPVAVSPVPV